MREKCPNLGLVGGIPCYYLGGKTKEECIDYVKGIIDDLGDHGLTLAQDKMVSFKSDFTRENTLAVNEFIRSYRGVIVQLQER